MSAVKQMPCPSLENLGRQNDAGIGQQCRPIPAPSEVDIFPSPDYANIRNSNRAADAGINNLFLLHFIDDKVSRQNKYKPRVIKRTLYYCISLITTTGRELDNRFIYQKNLLLLISPFL
jgi:hypothetical protein